VRLEAVSGRIRAVQLVVFEKGLDLELLVVDQFETVWAEYLDAVVAERIVTRADDDAGVGAHAGRQVGDGGGGDGAGEHDAAAHGADARGERRLQHVPGEPRVLADHDPHGTPGIATRDVGDGAS
jgi:hypothetical protein